MKKILYIHGFQSCGEGQKSSALKAYFGADYILAPNLPYAPLEAIAFLKRLIEKEKITLLVGSSLGGFYATHLAEYFKMSAVLINPATIPFITLERHLGWKERFCDGDKFEVTAKYLEQLKRLKVEPKVGNYLVLLQSDDELLNYKDAQELYVNQRIILEYGGNHRFENIEDYFSMIERF